MRPFYLALFATILVFNAKAQSVAKFDELILASESFWNGSNLSGSFKSADVTFYNVYNKDWQSWSGFAYSNMTDVKTSGYGNQFSAITGKGFEGSPNYAVCYPSPVAVTEFKTQEKHSGFYVTNSTYAYLSMKNGDMFAKKFGGESGNDPDYFKLMIESLNGAGNPVDTVYFYLADFRFSDGSKDYILNKWAWVDLSLMKEASKLRFSLSSSDNSFGYMNTPGYFCMDDLNGEKPYDYKPVTSAGFENLNLGAQGYYNGSDKKGGFVSGNFRFLTNYSADWGSWSGFAASSKNDTKTPGFDNQYSAITGIGVAGTPAYAIAYPAPVSTILFKDTVISGVYVTNSTYTYLSMKNGDAFSKKFGGENGNDDDWLILTIEGFDSDSKSTGKVEFFLADFAYSIKSNDYILDTWKWVNLSKLGRISKLEFSLRSSDNGTWGMNTPGYFCIDNLNHEVLTSAPEIQEIQVSVFPNPFTDRITISGLTESARVSVTDISGRLVAEYSNVSNNQSVTDMDKLTSGVYFLKIIDGKNQFTTKLIRK
ncbi:MAG: DUF4465 domain-containing protein [Bacteroidota bacterium]|nr:hypothetical protein [Odoribacter sp.]MDP3643918.1 DUF4465 domain-containing protein [Bacteroidota bacterium]